MCIKTPRQYHADHAGRPHCHGHPCRHACQCGSHRPCRRAGIAQGPRAGGSAKKGGSPVYFCMSPRWHRARAARWRERQKRRKSSLLLYIIPRPCLESDKRNAYIMTSMLSDRAAAASVWEERRRLSAAPSATVRLPHRTWVSAATRMTRMWLPFCRPRIGPCAPERDTDMCRDGMGRGASALQAACGIWQAGDRH